MLVIVSSPAQALANIRRFEAEVAKSVDLQSRLPYARAWYADKDADGEWHFGPSKFIGYQDIDAEKYLKEADTADGRRTEAQLQQWFSVAGPASASHSELHAGLVAFLAKYKKVPSTLARINLSLGIRRRFGPRVLQAVDDADDDDVLVRLLAAVASKLPEGQLIDLRERLEKLSH